MPSYKANLIYLFRRNKLAIERSEIISLLSQTAIELYTDKQFYVILRKKGCVLLAESIMLERAKDVAVEIVNICRSAKKTNCESVLTNQLMRSGTSIGANIHESKYAHGTADFVAKMQIALKECYESEYWLELLNRTENISDEEYKHLQNMCGSIRRMLISSINTVKNNSK